MSLNGSSQLGIALPATPEEIALAKALVPTLPGQHPNSKSNLQPPFAPGNRKGGRPVGSRNKLGEVFLKALHEDFLDHGVETIRKARIEDPVAYIKIIASLLPKDFKLDASDDMKRFMELVSRGGQVVTGPDGHKYIELDAVDISEARQPEETSPAITTDLLK